MLARRTSINSMISPYHAADGNRKASARLLTDAELTDFGGGEGHGARRWATVSALLVDPASHSFESGLGEVRQRRIAVLVAFQHPKRHQAKQHGTGHLIRGACSVPEGGEQRSFFGP